VRLDYVWFPYITDFLPKLHTRTQAGTPIPCQGLHSRKTMIGTQGFTATLDVVMPRPSPDMGLLMQKPPFFFHLDTN
jgi:hypothetical protein